MRAKVPKLILIAALAGLATWRWVGPPASDPVKAEDAKHGHPFDLPTLDGKGVSLQSLRGKVVLLDFWATWCPPCRKMIPVLQQLHRTYKDRGLVVVGVALDQGGASAVTPFVRDQAIDYPIAFPTQELLQRYGPIESIPVLFVLDREGRIRQRLVGIHGKEDLDRLVRQLLLTKEQGT